MGSGVWFGEQELVRRIRELPESTSLQVDPRHEFRQKIDPLKLRKIERQEFREIGEVSYLMLGVTARLYGELLANKSLFPKEGRDYFRQALEASLTRRQKRLQRVNPNESPRFFRVDCLLVRKEDGSFGAVTNEIEGGKPIGLGFGVFTQTVRQEIYRDSGPGLIEAMAASLYDFNGKEPIVHILAEDQLFYLPEQELFCQKMREMGTPIFLVREKDLQLRDSRVLFSKEDSTNKIFSLPLFNPLKSGKGSEEELLTYLYERGNIKVFIPPNGFLGTKAVYGLVHHPFFRVLYEDALRRAGMEEAIIDKYFPHSCLITGSSFEKERLLLEMGVMSNPPVMIKAVGLSATRGLAFPSEQLEMERLLGVAREKPFEYLIQEFKPQVAHDVKISAGDGIQEENQFFRLAAFYVVLNGRAELAEVVGTGLGAPLASIERPAVHGNLACTMFPVTFDNYE